MFRFITVLLICILSGAELDLFIPSFPELQKVFNLTPFMVQLTLSLNFVAYCICCLFAGTLGDRYNRRTIILVGLSIFVLGSLLCVTAANFPMLIVGRFLQGIGMAGPSVLGFVVIADEYPLEKQPAMMGILNGMITIAMAFAPVLGSYINYYFDWRANFALLLALSMICLIASFFAIPSRKGDKTISLSPAAYLPLLKSGRQNAYVIGIGFLILPYWVFIGMAPIFYMEDLGVPIKEFGYYQGAMAGVFSICSIFSSKILDWLKHDRCLYIGMGLCGVSAILFALIMFFDIQNPIIITGIMVILAIGMVFPINILYPQSLQVIENSKGRAAALISSFRLITTALALELVSYFYDGKFLPIGLLIFFSLIIAAFFIQQLLSKNWVSLAKNEG